LAAVKAAVAITAIIAGGRLVNLIFSRIMAFKWMDGISLD
jgi:GTP-dependent phosphoenolpyruvate carboxykinase